jgi:hypothetical protein
MPPPAMMVTAATCTAEWLYCTCAEPHDCVSHVLSASHSLPAAELQHEHGCGGGGGGGGRG